MIEKIDGVLLRFIQNWICDPMQFSGICIDNQLRGACAIAVIGWVWWSYFDLMEKRWVSVGIDGLIIPITLAYVFYGVDPYVKLLLAKSSAWAVTWVLFLAVDLSELFIRGTSAERIEKSLVSVGMVLRSYFVKCKPKPPVGSTKVVFDGV